MYNGDPLRVATPECRLVYCNLVTPRKGNESDPHAKAKYSVTILIPKARTDVLAGINAAVEAAKQAALSARWGGFMPRELTSPLTDGDAGKQSGEPFPEYCRGHWLLKAASPKKPGIVHFSDPTTELAPTDIYSGMYGYVVGTMFGYAHEKGGRGVIFCLDNVYKTQDGEPTAGGPSAADDFAGLLPNGGAPQAYVPPPIPAYVPAPQNGAVNPLTGAPIH